jgi:general secretion pathway protein G
MNYPQLLKAKSYQLTAHQSAFTLIELLIVITILGILMTIGYQSFYRSQEKARDAERKSDLRQIQKAMELYEQDRPNPEYPNRDTTGADTWAQFQSDLETNEYMKDVPNDPMGTTRGWVDYEYIRGADQLEYDLYACLENEDDADSDVANGKPERCTDAGAVSYTVTEP